MVKERIQKFAIDLHYEIYNKIYDSREDNYDTIQQGILEAFKALFIKANEVEKEVGYINISLLRSSIKNGDCLLLMSMSNSAWFLDKNPVEIYYDCSWLLKFLHEYEKKLSIEAKKYVGKIDKTDVEILKWESLDRDYKGFLTPMFRNSIEKVIELEEYKTIKKSTNLRILIGEHKDISEPIWVENNSLISATELKYNIKNKNNSVTGYNNYKDLDLSEDTYSYANLMYTKFERMNFKSCVMNKCLLLASKFWDCDLQNADLSFSTIWFADFSNSDLKGVNLSFGNYDDELEDYNQMDEKIFNRIKFNNADLTGADLSSSDLAGADFRGAILDNCNMEETHLRKALMDKKYQNNDKLVLDEVQKGMIIWV